MAELLRGVSLVVLLSEFETHPLVALEAAAAGCRLLVADASGLAELAADGFARAIPLDESPRPRSARRWSRSWPSRRRPSAPTLTSWDECAAAAARAVPLARLRTDKCPVRLDSLQGGCSEPMSAVHERTHSHKPLPPLPRCRIERPRHRRDRRPGRGQRRNASSACRGAARTAGKQVGACNRATVSRSSRSRRRGHSPTPAPQPVTSPSPSPAPSPAVPPLLRHRARNPPLSLPRNQLPPPEPTPAPASNSIYWGAWIGKPAHRHRSPLGHERGLQFRGDGRQETLDRQLLLPLRQLPEPQPCSSTASPPRRWKTSASTARSPSSAGARSRSAVEPQRAELPALRRDRRHLRLLHPQLRRPPRRTGDTPSSCASTGR